MATVANVLRWTLAGGALAGAACVSYGVLVERQWYRRVDRRLPILPAEASRPLRLLHLSDLHFLRADPRKAAFISSLPEPDVAVITGDLLGDPEAVEPVVAALRPVRGRLASYVVLGSNDVFAPRPLNYFAYFFPNRRRRIGARRHRTGDLLDRLEADGWTPLRNRRTFLTSDGLRFEVLGLDDPHIERADLGILRRSEPSATGLAVVHSPDPAPELAAFGYDLILAGHTHGGQVRLPFVGALVTNSTIPRKLCMGLSRLGPAYLHVSPGLGTSKFAKFRFLCRPEATVLDLVPRDGGRSARGGEGGFVPPAVPPGPTGRRPDEERTLDPQAVRPAGGT